MKSMIFVVLVLSLITPALLEGVETKRPPVSSPSEPSTLHVVMKPVRPFVFLQNGKMVGYSVDLWQRIAADSHLTFDSTTVETIPEMLEALQTGKADVGVGALSITSEREIKIDFTHPFYRSGLQILVKKQGSNSLGLALLKSFLNPDLLVFIAGLIVALFSFSVLLWFLERRSNPRDFSENPKTGIAQSLWWSTSIMITGGCENVAPIGLWGRLISVVWMLSGVALLSTVQGVITSTMTQSRLTSDIRSIHDLQGKSVATVDGSTTQKYLKEQGIEPIVFSNIEQAVDALQQDKAKAVVYDAPILRYLSSQSGSNALQIVGDLVEKQSYGFGLPEGSPRRKVINETMLRLSEEGYFDELDKKWFGSSSASP